MAEDIFTWIGVFAFPVAIIALLFAMTSGGANYVFNETQFVISGDNVSLNESIIGGSNITYVNNTYTNVTANLTGYWNTSGNSWITSSGNTATFNESKLSTTFYNASSLQVVKGTGYGTLGDIQTYNGITYNISEASSDLELRVNFTGITDFNNIIIRYRSDEDNEPHNLMVQLYDYNSGTWEDYGNLPRGSVFHITQFGVFDADEHISGGVVQLRFYQDGGVPPRTHLHEIDWVTISKGFGTPSGEEVDPIWTSQKANYVPYTGATNDVDLGTKKLSATTARIGNDNSYITIDKISLDGDFGGVYEYPLITFNNKGDFGESDNLGFFKRGLSLLGKDRYNPPVLSFVDETDNTKVSSIYQNSGGAMVFLTNTKFTFSNNVTAPNLYSRSEIDNRYSNNTGDQDLSNYYNKTSNLNAAGYNVTADYYYGNASFMTGIPSPDLNGYFLLDQSTPQTITNGIPLLTNLTPEQDYEIATKKYVDFSKINYVHNFDDFQNYAASTVYTVNSNWQSLAISTGTLKPANIVTTGLINDGGGGSYVGSRRMDNRLGVVALSSKYSATATANTGTQIRFSSDATSTFSEKNIGVVEGVLYFPTWSYSGVDYLTYAGEKSVVKFGFVSKTNTAGTNVVYTDDAMFMMDDGVLTINSRESGGSTFQTDITATANLQANTWYRFKVVSDWANDLDYYYIYAEDGTNIYSGSLTHGHYAGTSSWNYPTLSAIYTPSTIPTTYGVPIVMSDWIDFYIPTKLNRVVI